jgi:hypothetical protein
MTRKLHDLGPGHWLTRSHLSGELESACTLWEYAGGRDQQWGSVLTACRVRCEEVMRERVASGHTAAAYRITTADLIPEGSAWAEDRR